MSEIFDVRTIARELICKVKSAIDRHSVRDRLDVEITLGLMSDEEIRLVARELERNYAWPLGTKPYVSVSRGNQGNVVAIRFYAGWLDIDNYGRQLFVGTYPISL